jgi:hypothetical protein
MTKVICMYQTGTTNPLKPIKKEGKKIEGLKKSNRWGEFDQNTLHAYM